jgi:hypothetical protein
MNIVRMMLTDVGLHDVDNRLTMLDNDNVEYINYLKHGENKSFQTIQKYVY